MKNLLKNFRESKNLKTREVAQLLGIDQALVSKFETGSRKPTKEQVSKLASLFEIDYETIMTLWLKEKIIDEIGTHEFGLKALKMVMDHIKSKNSVSNSITFDKLQIILNEIDVLKFKLNSYDSNSLNSIYSLLDIEYTYESNRIEGNSISLEETELILNGGVTIAGKSMKEHLEIINHHESIKYIRNKSKNDFNFNEQEVLFIDQLVKRGIINSGTNLDFNSTFLDSENSIILSEQKHSISYADDLFNWYNTSKNSLHPIILAARTHEFLVSINSFKKIQGSTCRLIMNLILLKNGYLMANINGDLETIYQYYETLNNCGNTEKNENFQLFIATILKDSYMRCIEISKQLD